MKKTLTQNFIEQLQADTRQIIVTLKYLRQQDPEILLQQPGPGKWSVAQIIEHLNTYGRYYLPKLREARKHSAAGAKLYFTPGVLGGYFTRSMKPRADGTIPNKMKAFKNHTPDQNIDSKTVLDEFERQELLLLQLLNAALNINIEKVRIPVSIAPFIKLKMGDVFAFLIAHHQRHFVQISHVLSEVKANLQPLSKY